jgi:hypothetical protein
VSGSSRLRALGRLERVRERLRDVAAARANVATAALERAIAQEKDAQQELEKRLDNPPVQVTRAADLMGFDEERARALGWIAEAGQLRVAETKKADVARGELNVRERALRVIERQIAVAQRERQERLLRDEQKLADELSGRRSE